MEILDPRILTERDHIDYVPRPGALKDLRVGVIENTKKNAETLLLILTDKLKAQHGMSMHTLVHKPQRAPLTDSQANQLKGMDVAITGIGD